MITLIVTKATNKAAVNFDGKDAELRIVPVNKAGVKPGTHWIDLQKLGTPKKWFTVNYNDQAEDVFTVEVDETAHRTITAKRSRLISLSNIKDFLNDTQKVDFDGLYSAAETQRDKEEEEALKNAPVKEKKSRALTPEEQLAKMMANVEKLRAQIATGEVPAPVAAPKSKKAKKETAIESLE